MTLSAGIPLASAAWLAEPGLLVGLSPGAPEAAQKSPYSAGQCGRMTQFDADVISRAGNSFAADLAFGWAVWTKKLLPGQRE